MNIRTIIMAIIIGLACVTHAQTQVFVSSSGNDNSNGQTWETAKQTIAAGIAAAGDNGTVYVKAGSYSVSSQLNISADVSVKGGYRLSLSGTDTTGRDLPGTNSRWENPAVCTILTGGGSNRIAVVNGLLEGCVMRRGVTTGQGGGVLIDGGTVRYCVIRECDAIQESNRTAEGGGAYIRNNGVLTNCVITECRGDNGPAVSGGPGTLVNNTITRNWPTHCGKVADYDGNVYNTVVIGQQCWTHENLRTTHYNDGTAIPLGNNQPTSSTLPYYYINYSMLTATNFVNYGYHYNWPSVMHGSPSSNENPSGVTGICPLGWHVPSKAEWLEMRNFVQSIARYRCNGYDWQIGKALSSKSGWSSDNTTCNVGNNQGGNNITYFAAFPSGTRGSSSFSNVGVDTRFWSATSTSGTLAYYWILSNSSAYLYGYDDGNQYVGRSVRCVKQLENTAPVVVTSPPSMTSDSTAISGGSCWDGGSPITSYGVCWSTSPNPTIDDSHTVDGSGSAIFSSLLTGLTLGDSCYVRAYAVNGIGVGYGEVYGFVVSYECGDEGYAVVDFDGNHYSTVKIGNQCWMKENLRTTHYADGGTIALGTTTSTTVAYRYNPNNNSSNVPVYGYLYNWIAVMHGAPSSSANPSGVQGICPNGWHLPSHEEFTQLTDYLSGQSQYVCGGSTSNISKALASTSGWNSSSSTCAIGNNQSSNNASGFSAMPTGNYNQDGNYGNFGNSTQFWSATEYNNDRSKYRSLSYNSATVYMDSSGWYKKSGYSVRCVRDE